MSGIDIKLTESDLHPHLEARMLQRGVTCDEIEQTLNKGWPASDTKPGTSGKVLVFPYGTEWEGKFYHEKEITVYYKMVGKVTILLTVKARYGKNFQRR